MRRINLLLWPLIRHLDILGLPTPMGTHCAPLLADLFLYSYEANFIQKLLRNNNKN
jgi:hypothetical protein